MREIRFRVWDKENKRMLYTPDFIVAPLLSTDGEYKMVAMQSEKVLGLGDTNAYLPIPAQSELIQYTEVKDKNGREIYEGDIFTRAGKFFYTVVFYKGGFKLKLVRGGFEDMIPLSRVAKYGEVIGNIYENPELLEETPK